jgi:hypothetical protein
MTIGLAQGIGPIADDSMRTNIHGTEPLAQHGFHGIPKELFDHADLPSFHP